jgi:hypothetical protein
MRRFYLKREEDVSGVSGTGRVADGVEFENGLVAITWKSEYPSITVFQSITVVEKVHTHKGKDRTKIVWVDPKFEELEEKAKETKQAEREEMLEEAAIEEAAEAAANGNGHTEESKEEVEEEEKKEEEEEEVEVP